ncbi:MAG: RecX family transcriptional regulator [Bacteroidales bacterium]|nr:RecX family transcriptional regulator [Bacteroidales bacterium]
MKTISYERALHRLAAYCSKGEKCISDIRKKMVQWELSENDQNKILDRLQEENFLDEQRYVKAFGHDKSLYSKWGPYKIKYELKKRNIPDSLIRDALSEIDTNKNSEQLFLLLSHKRKTVKGKNDYEVKQKLIRFAAGRGYSIEDIENALSKIISS